MEQDTVVDESLKTVDGITNAMNDITGSIGRISSGAAGGNGHYGGTAGPQRGGARYGSFGREIQERSGRGHGPL